MRDKNGFLAEVEELLNQALGHPKGTLVLSELCNRHAGAVVYVPSRTELSIKLRNEMIKRRFRGDNYKDLAMWHGLTERQVRRIVNGQ